MCKLARAMAIEREPRKVGPLTGYSVTINELKKIYIRNGFQNMEVMKSHIDKWVAAEMAIRALDNVFFYLDIQDFDEAAALRKLEAMDGDIVGMMV